MGGAGRGPAFRECRPCCSKPLLGGLQSLQDYFATYVLTGLMPAFLLAGARVTLVDCETAL